MAGWPPFAQLRAVLGAGAPSLLPDHCSRVLMLWSALYHVRQEELLIWGEGCLWLPGQTPGVRWPP